MLIFSRMGTLVGSPNEVMAAAVAVTERVNEVIDSDVLLWAGGAGFPVGTVAWSGRMESHAELAENGANLAADEKYNELVAALGEYREGDMVDIIRERVHGEDADPPPVGGAVWQVTATIAGGHYVDGMAWGAEIAQMATDLTGVQTAFFQDLYGTFGQVTWLTGFESAGALDDARAAQAASEDWIAKVDSGGELFVPGSGHQGLATRVA